jgi:hypothetical protein
MDLQWMAACGLDCGGCEIRLALTDPAAAQVLVQWFKSQGWLGQDEGIPQILERKMYCTGCLGDRSAHWSADCWILQCCVDQRRHSHCAQCELFPCPRLVGWAGEDEAYAAALARLRQVHGAPG